jgi:hypothetical protein
MKNDLFFYPWISDNYKNGSGKFGKLLIIAESHYGIENATEYTTIDVVETVLTNDRSSCYKMFTKLGQTLDPDRNILWENCAFSNLIQYRQDKPMVYPKTEHLKDVPLNFYKILDLVKPEKVIVTSKRAWNNWLTQDPIDEYHNCEQLADLTTDNPKVFSEMWQYHYKGGNCLAIGTSHPSTAGFSDFTPLIKKFVNEF